MTGEDRPPIIVKLDPGEHDNHHDRVCVISAPLRQAVGIREGPTCRETRPARRLTLAGPAALIVGPHGVISPS
ncbi:MAG: hypothetical protein JWL97_3719 [Gemmatimonadales bacterium]|nr:hypothetical protein [Gemmatimonadales bacterium]